MDLSKPRTPSEDDDDNAINTFDSEEDDYENRNTGRNSSSNSPALKDQSHRLPRSSSNIIRCINSVLLIPILMIINYWTVILYSY